MVDVVAFLRKRAPKGIGQWEESVLRKWLTARAAAGEISIVSADGKIYALGAATERPDGKIAINALIGPRWLWPAMFRTFRNRWPDWKERVTMAVRRGRERPYTPSQLDRAVNGSDTLWT